MKYQNEFVKVHYKDEIIFAYLIAQDETQLIELIIENSKYRDELINNNSKTTFHCKKSNGEVISLFYCFLKSVQNRDILRYRVDTIVEGYVENIDNIKFSKISAIYPIVDRMFKYDLEDNELCVQLNFSDKKINITANRVEWTHHKDFETTISSELKITIETKSEEFDIKFANEIFFRINCLFSFLCDKYITYTHFEYFNEPNDLFEIKIYNLNIFDGNKFDLFNNNYGVLKNFGNKEFEKLLKPLNSNIIQVWLLYASTLRTNLLLEQKYLEYVRCIEIISRKETNSKIYSVEELREKLELYKKAINDMDLDKQYKDNLKNLFIYSNKKPFKSNFFELISKQDWDFRLKGDKRAKEIVKTIVTLRDHLTHGTTIDQIDTKSLFYYCYLVKEFLVAIMLKEHDIDYEHELKISQEKGIPGKKTDMMILLRDINKYSNPFTSKLEDT